MNKIIFTLIGVSIVVAGYFFWPKTAKGPGSSESTSANTSQNDQTNNSTNQTQKESEVSNLKFPGILSSDQITNKKAVLETDKGAIEFELYNNDAPKTVSNFVYLTQNNFFDGLTFHRVEPGFVIQGGDPSGNGTGGPGYKFADEAVIKEYKAGTVAMANAGPNTNGSQFFICLEDQPALPKNYTIFGQVTSGMEVVKGISVGDKIISVTIENK